MGHAANHLGRTKVAQLVTAIGSRSGPEPAPPATGYDWRQPHSFNPDQRNRLTQTLEQIAARMTEVFAHARSGMVKVSLTSLTEHYAGDLCRRLDMDKDFCLAFGPEQGLSCGFITIAPPTARAWVTWLLGDSDAGRALSALEESLLSDLLTGVLNVFLAPLRAPRSPGTPSPTNRNGETLQPIGSLCRGQPELQFELTEEVARIVFEVKTTDQGQPSAVSVLLPCSRLAALAGKTPTSQAPKVSPQELSRALMEHLQNLPVTVTAILASTTLTFQEVLELGPGDVLLLGKPVDGPAQLLVDDRPVFASRPARSEGRYAVVIVPSENGSGRQTSSTSTSQRKDARGNA